MREGGQRSSISRSSTFGQLLEATLATTRKTSPGIAEREGHSRDLSPRKTGDANCLRDNSGDDNDSSHRKSEGSEVQERQPAGASLAYPEHPDNEFTFGFGTGKKVAAQLKEMLASGTHLVPNSEIDSPCETLAALNAVEIAQVELPLPVLTSQHLSTSRDQERAPDRLGEANSLLGDKGMGMDDAEFTLGFSAGKIAAAALKKALAASEKAQADSPAVPTQVGRDYPQGDPSGVLHPSGGRFSSDGHRGGSIEALSVQGTGGSGANSTRKRTGDDPIDMRHPGRKALICYSGNLLETITYILSCTLEGKSEESKLLDKQYEALLREDKHESCFFLERPQDGASAPLMGTVAAAAFALGGGGQLRSGSSLTAGRIPSGVLPPPKIGVNVHKANEGLGLLAPEGGARSSTALSDHVTLHVSPFIKATDAAVPGIVVGGDGLLRGQVEEESADRLFDVPKLVEVDDAELDAFLDNLSIQENPAGEGATHTPQAFPGSVNEILIEKVAWKKSAFADASVMALAASAEDRPSSNQVAGVSGVKHDLLPRDFIARALKAPPNAIDQPGEITPDGSMEAIPAVRQLRPSRTFSHRQGVAIQVWIVT